MNTTPWLCEQTARCVTMAGQAEEHATTEPTGLYIMVMVLVVLFMADMIWDGWRA